MEKVEIIAGLGGLFCLVSGVLIGVNGPPNVLEIRSFSEQNKPQVLRSYKSGTDGVYVQAGKERERYIPLGDYLDKNFTNKYDRAIEKARIEKLVEW